MASATVTTPHSTSPAKLEDASPRDRFTAAVIHLVSVSDNEPQTGRKESCAWQEQVEIAYSEALQALFGCLPDGTTLEGKALVKILQLARRIFSTTGDSTESSPPSRPTQSKLSKLWGAPLRGGEWNVA
jgi:hypothetical protein